MIGFIVYPNTIVPGAVGLQRYELEVVPRTELTLISQMAFDQEIARMNLAVKMITAIDAEGSQHKMYEFPQQALIKARKGGPRVKLDSSDKLQPGTYTKLKFYIKPKDSFFTQTDKLVKETDLKCIEFTLQEPLVVRKTHNPDLEVRFDMPGMKTVRLLDRLARIKDVFSKPAFS